MLHNRPTGRPGRSGDLTGGDRLVVRDSGDGGVGIVASPMPLAMLPSPPALPGTVLLPLTPLSICCREPVGPRPWPNPRLELGVLRLVAPTPPIRILREELPARKGRAGTVRRMVVRGTPQPTVPLALPGRERLGRTRELWNGRCQRGHKQAERQPCCCRVRTFAVDGTKMSKLALQLRQLRNE
ncbi:hypothetical protein Vretifemale_4355 [Volvox reticuliferus]|uniref:Uncharacterized protein n=1 Tax=Volvox reticuliferus TaxID=1737510 RepID=A0A8J4FFM6_9CHLO|nr:hypothetical protein Vretifemale_4355 [Volvox reticuliferus]